jgi:hypothetical protein
MCNSATLGRTPGSSASTRTACRVTRTAGTIWRPTCRRAWARSTRSTTPTRRVDSTTCAEARSPTIAGDGPPRMEARPTGSGGEPSSPNCCDQCRGQARHPSYLPSVARKPLIRDGAVVRHQDAPLAARRRCRYCTIASTSAIDIPLATRASMRLSCAAVKTR